MRSIPLSVKLALVTILFFLVFFILGIWGGGFGQVMDNGRVI